MNDRTWWETIGTVMQYNLQVADTPGMNPERLAEQTEELSCDTVVMNVGGIYAWYRSQVPFHHMNEYLPEDRDLLGELIEAFHKRGIRFIARFDFSLAEDRTLLKRPEWFLRSQDGSPQFRGAGRMGGWSLLATTCALGGYRNEEVAVPVLKEVLDKYDIDGIFLNAPLATSCFCGKCRAKYEERYGYPMPENAREFERGWLSSCMKDNIRNLYDTIHSIREDVPLILYYMPYDHLETDAAFGLLRIDRDNIYDRYATADLICTESQDNLHDGIRSMPFTGNTTVVMKAGRRADEKKAPFGIIHSCPGMSWRHVGLPVAEYLPWMAQVSAGGGVLWHSVTGYPDTITDQRLLKAVGRISAMTTRARKDMAGANSAAEVGVIWDGSLAGRSMAMTLLQRHVMFDLVHDFTVTAEELKKYPAVVLTDGVLRQEQVRTAVREYVRGGGKLLAENTDAASLSGMADLFGISPQITEGETFPAGYIRLEEDGEWQTLAGTDKIAFRGKLLYTKAREGSVQVPATFIPPFAPPEAVGAPPERASLPVEKTEIPMAVVSEFEKGKTILLPFALSTLLQENGLEDHGLFLDGLLRRLYAGRMIETDAPYSVQITAFVQDGPDAETLLVHLVNETGQRPLRQTIPVHDISLRISLSEALGKTMRVENVEGPLEEEQIHWEQNGDVLTVCLAKLSVWEMIRVRMTK